VYRKKKILFIYYPYFVSGKNHASVVVINSNVIFLF